MLDKNKVKELYLQGKNAVYISLELGCSVDSVRKCIQRNLADFKTAHLIAKERDKEILKITRKEACNFMSDKDFIKRNPSIYRTAENGDIVINKEVAGALPFDVPKRFNNEFSHERVESNIIKAGYRQSTDLFSCKA